jgi:hypothetical protein
LKDNKNGNKENKHTTNNLEEFYVLLKDREQDESRSSDKHQKSLYQSYSLHVIPLSTRSVQDLNKTVALAYKNDDSNNKEHYGNYNRES